MESCLRRHTTMSNEAYITGTSGLGHSEGAGTGELKS
jgi:hypothetical protein